MAFREVLDGLVRAGGGVKGALLLDAEGESVLEAGENDFRQHLIGAHQGLALGVARRTSDRYGLGSVQCMVSRYGRGSVVVRPLRDGYYLVLSLAQGGDVPLAVQRSQWAQQLMNEEL